MKYYQTQSHFFIIFLVIAAMAFATIPPVLKAFAKTSDTYVVSELKKAQSEMFFYELDNGSFKNACMRGEIGLVQSSVLIESGNAVSCTSSDKYKTIALRTELQSGEIYCVDSLGFLGFVDSKKGLSGNCSK